MRWASRFRRWRRIRPRAFALARPQVLPTTLVLAPGGELHSVLIGPQTADSLIAATTRPAAEDPSTRAAPRFAPASGNEQG
jgi:hypothetical protein